MHYTIDVKYANKGILGMGGSTCFLQNILSHLSLKENISPLCFQYWVFRKGGEIVFVNTCLKLEWGCKPCLTRCKGKANEQTVAGGVSCLSIIFSFLLKIFLRGESHTFSNIFPPKLLYRHLDHAQVTV